MKVILDADVLIGALDSTDAHHVRTRELFGRWQSHDDLLITSVLNLSEVLVAPARRADTLRVARAAIAALGITVHLPTEAIAVAASRLRGGYAISLPDAFLLATARHSASTVASFDGKVNQAASAEGLALMET